MLERGARPSMNSVFLYGNQDPNVAGFLEKLGYAVMHANGETELADILNAHADIIVIDGRIVPDFAEVCAFLRSQPPTREVPIICISDAVREGDDRQGDEDFQSPLERIERVLAPYSVGSLVGKIATQLRLSKLAGADEHKATLAEANLALRDHAERMQRDLREARLIQESLLPAELPKDDRVDIAASHQSLDEVGGDWYYVQQEVDGAISLYISDVSGHGLPAALISSMAKLAVSASYDPAVNVHLEQAAKLLGAQLPPSRFVTMAICRFFPESGRLQWARAGHPPALVLRRGLGEVVELKGDGFPVGFVDTPSYELVEIVLDPGDEVLIFTDGVSEVQNRAMEVFGLEHLSAALKSQAPHQKAADSLAGIVDAIDIFRDERLLKDDVTLILLKRCA